jgi:hypothetical protein
VLHEPALPAPHPPSRVLPVVLVAVAVILSCYPFIAPGHPSSVDTWPHLARQKIVYDAIRGGFSPFFTFMYYSGFPVLRFYSPLFYFLGGPLTLLTAGNLVLALRILQILLHLLSALAMYLFLRRRPGGEYGAALGTIVFLMIPWRVLYQTGIANYPQALVYVLLPLLFMALERLLERMKQEGQPPSSFSHHPSSFRRQALLLGLWAGLLVLSHLVYALYAFLFFVLWLVLELSFMRQPIPGKPLARAIAISAVAGIGVSAFFAVPFLFEQAAHRFPIVHANLPVPQLMVMLGFKLRVGGYEGIYWGLTVLLLLVIAMVAVLSRRALRSQVPALVGLLVSLFLVFGPALLKEKQYLMTTGLPPERFLVFTVFFTALLVPSAYDMLREWLARWRVRPGVVLGVAAGLVMFDCLFTLLHASYTDRGEFLAVRGEIYPMVGAEPHARLLDLNLPESRVDDSRRTSRLPTVGVIYGDLPTPLGLPYHQYAPRSMLYVYSWANWIAADNGDTSHRPLSENTYKALALMGVSHLITLPTMVSASGTNSGPFYLVLKRTLDWDGRFVAAKRIPPLALGRTFQGLLLASERLQPMPPETLTVDRSFVVASGWRRMLDTLSLDQQAHRLNFIPVLPGAAPSPVARLPSPDTVLALTIDTTAIRHQDVMTRFRAGADCFLRIAVSYYPELRVLLDGRQVEFHETADHFIYIRCPAGSHTLQVVATMSLLRVATLWVSVLALLLVLVLLAFPTFRLRCP